MANHITKAERDQIAVLYAQSLSRGEIGRRLGRSKSTISRELRRNSDQKGQYLSHFAQEKSENLKAKAHKRERLKNKTVRSYVDRHLVIGYSPDIIAGRLKIDLQFESISHEAIYQYIYNDKPELGIYLPSQRVKRIPKSAQKRGSKSKIPNRVPISERPENINNRTEFGHFEADSMVSSLSKVILNVVVERKTRYTMIHKLENKTAEETVNAMIDSLQDLPFSVLSITYDNGTEFTYHERINEALKSKSYFCAPYHSWEKGSVENRNWFIRRFLPKKTDFAIIEESFLMQIQEWLNNRPMKCLNYLTPKEMLALELKRCV